jgi:hypothetical protein
MSQNLLALLFASTELKLSSMSTLPDKKEQEIIPLLKILRKN